MCFVFNCFLCFCYLIMSLLTLFFNFVLRNKHKSTNFEITWQPPRQCVCQATQIHVNQVGLHIDNDTSKLNLKVTALISNRAEDVKPNFTKYTYHKTKMRKWILIIVWSGIIKKYYLTLNVRKRCQGKNVS